MVMVESDRYYCVSQPATIQTWMESEFTTVFDCTHLHNRNPRTAIFFVGAPCSPIEAVVQDVGIAKPYTLEIPIYSACDNDSHPGCCVPPLLLFLFRVEQTSPKGCEGEI